MKDELPLEPPSQFEGSKPLVQAGTQDVYKPLSEAELKARQQPLAVRQSVDVAAMLQKVIEGGVTGEGVEALEKLIGLYERMEDRKAEKAFAAAFVRLQKVIPKVKAVKPVKDKAGNVKFKVAPFQDIDEQVRPLALAEGFSYWFSEGERQAGLVTEICHIQHSEGHKRSVPYTVRIGQGPHGATETQSDMAAHSSAKRGALCNGFTIVIDHEADDARNLGAQIAPEKAEELRRRVRNMGVNETAYLLAFSDGKEFEDIMSARLEDAEKYLDKVSKRRAV